MIRLLLLLPVVVSGLAPLPAVAAEWSVDQAKSKLGFTGTMAQAPFTGQFQHWTAAISFDPAKPEAGHVLVKVDMASAITGDKQKDSALPQSDWFDAKAFPEAVFEVQSFKPKGGSVYDAVATLTMRGVKKDLTTPLSIEIDGNTMHAKGGVNLLRTDSALAKVNGPAPSGWLSKWRPHST